MNTTRQYIVCAIIALFASATAQAQDFVYKPINPAFGGDTFNYSWLLSAAQSQDLTTDPNKTTSSYSSYGSLNSLDDFKQSLNRQLLSQLSRQLVTSQFGEDGLKSGNYSVGDYQIDVTNGADGIIVTILDTTAGEQTQLVIPYY